MDKGNIKIDLIEGDDSIAFGRQTIRVENPDDPEQYVMVERRIIILPSGQIFPAPYGSPF